MNERIAWWIRVSRPGPLYLQALKAMPWRRGQYQHLLKGERGLTGRTRL